MYDLWEVNPEHLPAILAEVAAPSTTEPAWAGLSVTMPHKQTVLPMLDAVTRWPLWPVRSTPSSPSVREPGGRC